MRKFLSASFASLVIAACGGESTAPAPAAMPDTAEPKLAHIAPDQAPAAVETIIDVPKIAGRSFSEVTEILGASTSCEAVKQGKKCFFTPGGTEIVFISGKADWITVEALDSAPYSEEVLPLLGLRKTTAVISNENTIRWEAIPSLLEVSVFPAQGGVDYAYIKTATP